MSSAVILKNLKYVVTVNATNTVFENKSVLISDGQITGIDDFAELQKQAPAAEVVDCSRKLAMPGLINLHTHTPMTLLRGLAEDTDLQGFLKRIWAAEGAVMNPQTVELGAKLGAVESLLGGVTTTLDMYFHHADGHRGAVAAGSRHIGGPTFMDFPGPDNKSWDERISWLDSWPAELREIGGPEVPTMAGPHGTYTVSEAHLREVISGVTKWENPLITIHISENDAENADVHDRFGKTPTELLIAAGGMEHDFPIVFGHGVRLSASDRKQIANSHIAVAHCPGSNLKLASGALDWNLWRADGVNLGIGTDGCSTSNDLDMWVSMRLAGLLGKLTANDPTVATATEILRAATFDGAKALGMDQKIGSLEVGKQADLVLLDLDAPHLTPVNDVPALLVFAAGRGDVSDVMVDGDWVVRNRKSTKLDMAELLEQSRVAGAKAAKAADEA
jgi:5-methylthioadenosine/S-adenosylhomocysteine deaminase